MMTEAVVEVTQAKLLTNHSFHEGLNCPSMVTYEEVSIRPSYQIISTSEIDSFLNDLHLWTCKLDM